MYALRLNTCLSYFFSLFRMGAVNMVAAKKDENGNTITYNSKITVYMIIVAILGSFGGLLFGYDLGVTGGNNTVNIK